MSPLSKYIHFGKAFAERDLAMRTLFAGFDFDSANFIGMTSFEGILLRQDQHSVKISQRENFSAQIFLREKISPRENFSA